MNADMMGRAGRQGGRAAADDVGSGPGNAARHALFACAHPAGGQAGLDKHGTDGGKFSRRNIGAKSHRRKLLRAMDMMHGLTIAGHLGKREGRTETCRRNRCRTRRIHPGKSGDKRKQGQQQFQGGPKSIWRSDARRRT